LYRFLAIAVLLDVKDIPQVGPLQWGWITTNPASRLKGELMTDAVNRLLGKDEASAAPDNKPPRVLLALANHGHSSGWDHAKTLQRQIFDASVGGSLQMKFAFFGPDNDAGVRRFRITKRWIGDSDEMAGLIDRAECNCGCYVHICSVLGQAVKENADRSMRALVIVGDAFHDSQDSLDEAALSANQLRRAGTRLFLVQQGDDPVTARKLQYLAKVSGGAYFRFDPRTQERQFAEMLSVISSYATGGEAAVKATGGQAGTLLLEQLKQEPMPVIEAREYVRVNR
jgi:hypothetical protein